MALLSQKSWQCLLIHCCPRCLGLIAVLARFLVLRLRYLQSFPYWLRHTSTTVRTPLRHAGIEPTLRHLNDAVLQHTRGAGAAVFRTSALDGAQLLLPTAGRVRLGVCRHQERAVIGSSSFCFCAPGDPGATAFALPSRWHPLPRAVKTISAPSDDHCHRMQSSRAVGFAPDHLVELGASKPRPARARFNLQRWISPSQTTIITAGRRSPG